LFTPFDKDEPTLSHWDRIRTIRKDDRVQPKS
jgi:hypothetical protein